MEVSGKIKKVEETKTYGSKGFKKRELVVTTNEQYPQDILLEFIQDKCDILDKYKVGQDVKVSVNIRGREWINTEGVAKYFNTIQGWRIESVESDVPSTEQFAPVAPNEEDGLPFQPMKSTEEMIGIVQHYINCRTGKEVNISVNSIRDIFLLNKAYGIAVSWFNDNNYNISIG